MFYKPTLIAVVLVLPVIAHADAPALQNTGPVIYLADNLDEKDNWGYCIDTQDRGRTERIQLHSCKPDSDNSLDRDVLFSLNAETGRIEHVEFAGFCLIVNEAGAETALGLLTCDDSDPQKFTFDAGTGEIHPGADAETCLVASPDSKNAGPFMSRPLNIAACADTQAELKTFVVQGGEI